MKAIIGRMVYDTEKSESLTQTVRVERGDTLRITETLYRSPNLGHFFVAKEEYDLVTGTSSSIYVLEDHEAAAAWLGKRGIVDIELFERLGIKITEA